MTDSVYYRSDYSYTNYPAIFAARVVNIIIGIVELLLLVRIIFELLGASAISPFVSWIYGISGALLGPFAGAFPNIALGSGSMLDIDALLGILVYAVIGWLVNLLLSSILNATVRV